MIIDNINLNHLRVFESVYRTRSMTSAAKELHLTQSGVSQHVKSLEYMLDTKLFDRIKQKLIPTTDAAMLVKECSQGLYQIENILLKIKKGENHLSGKVRIGVPIEFGKNIILPLLAEFGKKHPMLQFKIELGFAPDMNKLLLMGDIDFAFVDQFGLDKRIETKSIYHEVLGLYIHKDLLEGKTIKNDKKFYESLTYVDYFDDEPVLRRWFEHHLKHRNLNLIVKATVMNVQGIARLVLAGLGAGIIPGHHIRRTGKEKESLVCLEGTGSILYNEISAAFLRERTHSPATVATLNYLFDELNKMKKK